MDEEFDERYWDERYRGTAAVWTGQPNPGLVAEVAELPPGRALDVGCGEGGDALWLARRGWRVTATDISRVALDRAAARVASADAAHADAIEWRHADLATWVPPAESFDLVSAQYFHLTTPLRERVQRALAAAVAPGGTLLIVGHEPTDHGHGPGAVARPDLYFGAQDVVALLDADTWKVLVAESRARTWSGPDGHRLPVGDVVVRARRLP